MAQVIGRLLDLKPLRMRVNPIIKLLLRHAFGFGEAVVHKQIGIVIANKRAVLVVDLERVLLFHVQAQLPELMGQCVFIGSAADFLTAFGGIPAGSVRWFNVTSECKSASPVACIHRTARFRLLV